MGDHSNSVVFKDSVPGSNLGGWMVQNAPNGDDLFQAFLLLLVNEKQLFVAAWLSSLLKLEIHIFFLNNTKV